ncbi:SURF1 family protein [Halodurantibacterium flavum]|uniref:SURF1-like protein n=1 Tax=Halodurantibacterium flavum TaxID=1382802 RepID=A0ABW4S6C9_9RHOB
MRRILLPLLFGIAGTAILLSLGFWQVQRLHWKEAVIAEIEAQIHADPVPLPDAPDPATDRYRPVMLRGQTTGEELHVLVSRRGMGAGFLVVSAFETEDGRRVLLDRGYVREAQRRAPRPPVPLDVTGNLNWPQEADGYTPDPDPVRELWFARDVPRMAEALGTEPVLVVARESTGDGIEAMPVDTSAIPNDHLNYAITWFLLAAVWAGMTGYYLWRITLQRDEGTDR